jgi:hypothetical protein
LLKCGKHISTACAFCGVATSTFRNYQGISIARKSFPLECSISEDIEYDGALLKGGHYTIKDNIDDDTVTLQNPETKENIIVPAEVLVNRIMFIKK